jgi:hypothetical protein
VRSWSSGKKIRYSITAVWLAISVVCVVSVVRFFSDPERPVIGDPAPQSKTVILHNAASIPLLVSDDSSYASRVDRLRLAPGETQNVEVGYVPRNFGAGEWKNRLCLGAETEERQQTFYECLTFRDLDGSGWRWEIRTDFIQGR